MNKWLKQNPANWKWYHWLAYYPVMFAACAAALFIYHLLFGHPFDMMGAVCGAAGGTTAMALMSRRTGRKRS